MYNTGQPTLGLEFQERLDNWARCSVAPGEWEAPKHYDFRTFRGLKIALYHAMGDLPVPKTTHRFFRRAQFSIKPSN